MIGAAAWIILLFHDGTGSCDQHLYFIIRLLLRPQMVPDTSYRSNTSSTLRGCILYDPGGLLKDVHHMRTTLI